MGHFEHMYRKLLEELYKIIDSDFSKKKLKNSLFISPISIYQKIDLDVFLALVTAAPNQRWEFI